MDETKVLCVGDSGTGKDTVLRNALGNYFETYHNPTMGAEAFELHNYTIWTIAGDDRFRGLGTNYYMDAKIGCIFVEKCDIETIRSLRKWYNELLTVDNIKVCIFVNKIDILCDNFEEESNMNKIHDFADPLNIPVYLISARTITKRKLKQILDEVKN